MDELPACCDDPDMWDAARPKHDQRYAARTCQRCPVRASCERLARRKPPRGLIQAGFRWDLNGKPHRVLTGVEE